jgi:hypothetical protein
MFAPSSTDYANAASMFAPSSTDIANAASMFSSPNPDYASAATMFAPSSTDFTNAATMFTPTTTASSSPAWYMTFGAPPTTPTGSAFNSASTGGFSMYFGDVAAAQQKSQAVYTMRVYETSLRGGAGRIAPAGTTAARTYGVDRTASVLAGGHTTGTGTPSGGGVPWDRLVGRAPLAPGPAVGGAIVPGATPVGSGGMPAEPATGRAGHPGGMVPPVGTRTAEDEEPHRNRMPVIDHQLFSVEVYTSGPVIGS